MIVTKYGNRKKEANAVDRFFPNAVGCSFAPIRTLGSYMC